MQVAEALELIDGPGGREFRCRRCSNSLGGSDRNYKESAAYEESEITEANPLIRDPGRYVDETIVLRRYFCPGCGVQLDVDICRQSEAPLWDIRID